TSDPFNDVNAIQAGRAAARVAGTDAGLPHTTGTPGGEGAVPGGRGRGGGAPGPGVQTPARGQEVFQRAGVLDGVATPDREVRHGVTALAGVHEGVIYAPQAHPGPLVGKTQRGLR